MRSCEAADRMRQYTLPGYGVQMSSSRARWVLDESPGELQMKVQDSFRLVALV